jgi:ADP-ribose pyrophosphatase YjhB (NUDIX family)
MKREYPEAPLVGVGAVIVDGGRVVVIRRGSAPLLGEWSIPGGVLELGETVRAAVVREALEETGLQVEAVDLLGVFDRVVKDERGAVRFHFVLVDFLCRVKGGELRAGHDAADARWLTGEELEVFPMEAKAKAVLRQALEAEAGKTKRPAGSQSAGRR